MKLLLSQRHAAQNLEELSLSDTSLYHWLNRFTTTPTPENYWPVDFLKLQTLEVNIDDSRDDMIHFLQLDAPFLDCLSFSIGMRLTARETDVISRYFTNVPTLKLLASQGMESISHMSEELEHRPQLNLARLKTCSLMAPCGCFDLCALAGCTELTSLRLEQLGMSISDCHYLETLRLVSVTSLTLELFHPKFYFQSVYDLFISTFPSLVSFCLTTPSATATQGFLDALLLPDVCLSLADLTMKKCLVDVNGLKRLLKSLYLRQPDPESGFGLLLTSKGCHILPDIHSVDAGGLLAVW